MFKKRHVYRIYQDVLQLNEKIHDPIEKCAKDLNRHFFNEDRQMASMYMERCTVSLAIREMQIKKNNEVTLCTQQDCWNQRGKG